MINDESAYKNETDEVTSSIAESFPWLSEFRKMCKCIHTERSMASLTELMQFYSRNVSISVNECYTKPLRAAKLKASIGEALLLFLYIYRELPEGHDRSNYLNNMSDLLVMYIDMELKASKKSKEDHGKICARLTSCLYVYLEHSTEHLLDTLIKIHFMCRSYHYILDPIITKIIKSIPMHPESNVMYVRYLLIYRLWRKINDDVAVKNQITSSAIASLGSPPSVLPAYLENVLPKVPKYQPNSTKFLLQHKFDIRKSCDLFIRYCREGDKNATNDRRDADTRSSSSNGPNSQTGRHTSNLEEHIIRDHAVEAVMITVKRRKMNTQKLSDKRGSSESEIFEVSMDDSTTNLAEEASTTGNLRKQKNTKIQIYVDKQRLSDVCVEIVS